MTIYIHGFSSSGQGKKANLFREYYQGIGKPFIAPSLSCVPELAISILEELINSYDSVNLTGSSLAVEDIASDRYLLMLQKGDDVLDYREAVTKIPHATLILEEGGTHTLEGIEWHFGTIRDFLTVTR